MKKLPGKTKGVIYIIVGVCLFCVRLGSSHSDTHYVVSPTLIRMRVRICTSHEPHKSAEFKFILSLSIRLLRFILCVYLFRHRIQ
jgi:hypothetical protein